ncbi:hypothetical protein [uncultured Ottowia sp.]|uniref:hypothetical protein n=1 Tax=uncultured Ottowia sp. TaxID=543067 RepID=UPI002594593C|nr:hypothetical protein [uncultured Ottowia sp.]
MFTRSDYIKKRSENNGSEMPSSAIPLGHIAIDSGAVILPAACPVFCKSKSVKKSVRRRFLLEGWTSVCLEPVYNLCSSSSLRSSRRRAKYPNGISRVQFECIRPPRYRGRSARKKTALHMADLHGVFVPRSASSALLMCGRAERKEHEHGKTKGL